MKKKHIFIFLLTSIFFLKLNVVFADVLKVGDVATEFEKTKIIVALKAIDSSEENLIAEVNETNKTIDIKVGTTILASFDYNDEYIEYDDRSTVVTQDNCTNNVMKEIYLEGIVEAIFNLSGYQDKTIDTSKDIKSLSYDEYGIQMETEHYEYNSASSDGTTTSQSGEYLKYFKISLDTDKIKKVAEEYGTDSTEDEYKKFADTVPTVRIGDITSSSLTVYPVLTGYSDYSDVIPLCSIYRSTSKDGEYEKISGETYYSCTEGTGIIEENLQSDTTYYYKAQVLGSDKFSDVVEAKTLSADNVTSTTSTDEVTNPKTGGTFIILVVFCLALSIVCFTFMIKHQKKSAN